MRLMVLTFVILPAVLYGQGRKPVITGHRPLVTTEEQSLTIQLNDLYVTDPDSWFYPWGFSLTVHPGENYTLSGNTVIPDANFNGTLSVSVTV
ncbi:MAG TPA: hypothetical protein VD816_02365, partial [Ohtaekwangia sp.]|nr:hypothetical protein [Ohtaekwangia sp.]